MLTTRASAAGFPALKSSSRRSDDTGKNTLLSAPHYGSGARRSGGMVVSEDMQRTVNYESQDLLPDWHALPLRVVACDLRTNVDVPNHGAALPRPSQPEGDNVSVAAVPKIAAIERRNRRAADEGDRQHRIPDPFRFERGDGGFPHPRPGHHGSPDAR